MERENEGQQAVETGCRWGQGSARAVVSSAVETGCRWGQGSARAVVSSAVDTGCRGGQGSPGAAVSRAVETLEEAKAHQGCSAEWRRDCL
jgi:hypothetical protein